MLPAEKRGDDSEGDPRGRRAGRGTAGGVLAQGVKLGGGCDAGQDAHEKMVAGKVGRGGKKEREGETNSDNDEGEEKEKEEEDDEYKFPG